MDAELLLLASGLTTATYSEPLFTNHNWMRSINKKEGKEGRNDGRKEGKEGREGRKGRKGRKEGNNTVFSLDRLPQLEHLVYE